MIIFKYPSVTNKLIKQSLRGKQKFEKWMKPTLKPNEYYKLKESMLTNKVLPRDGNETYREDAYRMTNWLTINLLEKRAKHDTSCMAELEKIKLLVDIDKNEHLSLYSREKGDYGIKQGTNIKVIAPVCPDYSHVKTDNGYRYTFEGVNGGIGVVARKAIQNINNIKKIGLGLRNLNIEHKILVGDFEATQQNLSALKMSENEFSEKAKSSCEKIQMEGGISSSLFTSITGGLEGWRAMLEAIKAREGVMNYDDLKEKYPTINHDSILISRIPLYAKWHKQNANFKELFFDQVMEYITMGHAIRNYYGENCILLASDHRAMRPYYNAGTALTVVSGSAKY